MPYIKDIDGKKIHLAYINGNYALDFIKSHKGQLFCLSLSFWSPHADDDSIQQCFWPSYCDSPYNDITIPEPVIANPAYFTAQPDFLKKTMNRKRWYWRYDSPGKYQRMVKRYYKMISGVYSVIDRIQKTSKEQGVADNTVIVFMDDNGLFLGEKGYAGKWLMYEQSIRVPMIIYDPRLPKSIMWKNI